MMSQMHMSCSAALNETNTAMELFSVKSEDAENAIGKMPQQISAALGTMRIRPVINLPQENWYTVMSAACAQHGSSLTASASTRSIMGHSQPERGIHSHSQKCISSGEAQSWLGSGACSDMMKAVSMYHRLHR